MPLFSERHESSPYIEVEKNARVIGSGDDSVVLHVPGFNIVYKLYNSNVTPRQLDIYRQLTSRAIDIFNGKRFEGFEYNWYINPITSIGWSDRIEKSGSYCVVAPYIEGQRLVGSSLRYDPKDFETVSRTIRSGLRNKAIKLDPVNVKFTTNRLVITDLCSSISRIR